MKFLLFKSVLFIFKQFPVFILLFLVVHGRRHFDVVIIFIKNDSHESSGSALPPGGGGGEGEQWRRGDHLPEPAGQHGGEEGSGLGEVRCLFHGSFCS